MGNGTHGHMGILVNTEDRDGAPWGMGHMSNGAHRQWDKEISMRYSIRWFKCMFKCKLKPPKNAGVVSNKNDHELKSAADAELFNIEQQVLQQQQHEKRASPVSHVHKYQIDKHSMQDEYYHHVHTVNCLVYVPHNEEKQEILLPSATEMFRKENAKTLYTDDENFEEWNADPYFDESNTDTETFSYAHYDGPNQVMV